MKKSLLSLVTILIWIDLGAQVTDAEKYLRTKVTIDSLSGWKKGGIVSLNLSQTSLSNWSAGGDNSFATSGIISLFANWKKDSAQTWDNNLDIGYGTVRQGANKQFIKTDD